MATLILPVTHTTLLNVSFVFVNNWNVLLFVNVFSKYFCDLLSLMYKQILLLFCWCCSQSLPTITSALQLISLPHQLFSLQQSTHHTVLRSSDFPRCFLGSPWRERTIISWKKLITEIIQSAFNCKFHINSNFLHSSPNFPYLECSTIYWFSEFHLFKLETKE